MITRRLLPLLLLLMVMAPAVEADRAPLWTTTGPVVAEDSYMIELPIEVIGNKIYVQLHIEGEPKRFVFDTGSPSMISKRLANELGLEAIDTMPGRDSHGAVISSDIVQAQLTIGETTFSQVPIFAADFSSSKAAQCFLGDGVLGSEILPKCALQIDLENSVIRCHSALDTLPQIDDSQRQPLYTFGYPHTPYLDVRFAKDAVSKAMFDTGSAAVFTISPPDFEGAERSRVIRKTMAGHGSLGGSLGGQAPIREQRRAELRSLEIGDLDLGRQLATVRESPPSLVGFSILKQYVVTLDPASESAYFRRYADPPRNRGEFGFSFAFDDAITVGLVWERSAAAKAGLRAGDRVTAINGVATDTTCDAMQQALQATAADSIALELGERTIELEREN